MRTRNACPLRSALTGATSLVLLTSVAACGSSSSDTESDSSTNAGDADSFIGRDVASFVTGDTSGMATLFGELSLEAVSVPALGTSITFAEGQFYRTSEATTVATAFLPVDSVIGDCRSGDVGALGAVGDVGTGLPIMGFVDAGSSVTLSANGVNVANLVPVLDDSPGRYDFDEDDEGPEQWPAGLTVDIAGGEFPAMTNVTVPDVAPLTGVGITTTGDAVTADSTISWNRGNDANALILVEFELETDDVFIDVDCVIADTGSFAVPTDVQTQIQGGATVDSVFITRVRAAVERQDDAALLITNTTLAVAF